MAALHVDARGMPDGNLRRPVSTRAETMIRPMMRAKEKGETCSHLLENKVVTKHLDERRRRYNIHIMMPSGLYPAAVMVLSASRLPSL